MQHPTTTLLLLAALGASCQMQASTNFSLQPGAPESSKASATQGASKESTAASLFPYTVQRTTLDNGLKVLLIPMPSDGLVSFWSVVRTGSRDEVEEGVSGFAHFFEHMMFRGSEKYPAREYDAIVSSMGADANAFTTDDFTAYHMSFGKPDLERVIEIEADRFQNLKYDEDQFKTEAGAVYGEYRKGRTSPFGVLFEAMQDAAFDKHTYKHTTIGFERDIQNMPAQFDYSKTFFKRFYRPENVVLVVTGDIDAGKTLESIKQHYGGWKRGYTAPEVPVEPEQRAQRRIDVPFDGKTKPILSLNFKGEAFKPTDRAMLAGTLIGELAFGETSPVYKKLVLDEQRVEALFASFGFSRDPGLWSVLARVKDPADVAAIEAELWSALDELRTQPVDAARLADVRSRMKYEFLSGLSTPSQVSEALAPLVAITGDITCIDPLYATLTSVTPADVQAAAAHYLTPARCTVALVHSKGEPLSVGAERKVADKTSGARVSQAPVLLPVAQDPNVAFKIWFKVGSQDDPPGKEGLAALTGALISDGGTQRNAYEAILAKLFPLAASYGASVDKEMTVVSGLVHRDKVAAFRPLLVDALVRPGFRTEDFERLRDQTISGIEKSLRFSSDEELGKAALYQTIFAGTPYSHIGEGTVAALKSITLDDVKAFHAAHYTRDNVVIGLGGAYDKALPEELALELGQLPEGTPAQVAAPRPAPISGRHALLVEKPGPSTAISFGYPLDLHRGSREFYALWIANSWLGEHRNSSSHLYQVIRETRGMNYGDYSYIEAYPNGGRRTNPPTGVGRREQIFEVWIRPVPREQALFALRAALREVELLAKNGLTREDFEATRKFLKNYVLHFAETTAERLGYAIDDRYFGVDGHLAKFRKLMDEITLEETNAAIKKYLQVENLQIAMVTEKAAELATALAADQPSPITYPAGITKSAEVLAEDKLIEKHPLRIPAANVKVVPVEQMFAGVTPSSG